MTAERESMTLQEMGAPALGVEERRDEAPRAGASHARPTPDPEVVAKPKRRKFTAQYRLRILEEAESCTQPGEVGRLLRREGLYSSHLTEWRRARREGSLQGLTPSKRGQEARRAQPPRARLKKLPPHARGPQWLGLDPRSCTRPIDDPGRPGTSCPAGAASNGREGLLGRPDRNSHRRSAGAADAERWGCQRASCLGVRGPSSRASAAPSYALMGPACVQTRAMQILDELASPRFVAGHGPGRPTLLDEGRYLCADAHDVPDPGRELSRCPERRNQRSHPCCTKPELVATGPNQTWSWESSGNTGGPNAGRPSNRYVLLEDLQPLRRGLDGCRSGERCARRDADRTTCHQSRHRNHQVLTGIRDRLARRHQQVHRPIAADLGIRRQISEPAPRSSTQPLLRGAVQDPEVSPRLPCPLDDITAAKAYGGRSSRYRHRAPPCRDPCSPPMMSSSEGCAGYRADVPCKPISRRTLRPRHETQPRLPEAVCNDPPFHNSETRQLKQSVSQSLTGSAPRRTSNRKGIDRHCFQCCVRSADFHPMECVNDRRVN